MGYGHWFALLKRGGGFAHWVPSLDGEPKMEPPLWGSSMLGESHPLKDRCIGLPLPSQCSNKQAVNVKGQLKVYISLGLKCKLLGQKTPMDRVWEGGKTKKPSRIWTQNLGRAGLLGGGRPC